jgi:hypothetical protein
MKQSNRDEEARNSVKRQSPAESSRFGKRNNESPVRGASRPNAADGVQHSTIKHHQKSISEKETFRTAIQSGQKGISEPNKTNNKSQPTKRRKLPKHQSIRLTTFDHKATAKGPNHDQPTIQSKRRREEGKTQREKGTAANKNQKWKFPNPEAG